MTQPPQQRPWLHGTVERIQCPNCGAICDYREIDSQNLLDTGSQFTCQRCFRPMEVVAIRVVKFISVRPYTGPAVRGRLVPARQATTISHGQLQKMLKG